MLHENSSCKEWLTDQRKQSISLVGMQKCSGAGLFLDPRASGAGLLARAPRTGLATSAAWRVGERARAGLLASRRAACPAAGPRWSARPAGLIRIF